MYVNKIQCVSSYVMVICNMSSQPSLSQPCKLLIQRLSTPGGHCFGGMLLDTAWPPGMAVRVFIKGGCSRRWAQWMGVVLSNKLV